MKLLDRKLRSNKLGERHDEQKLDDISGEDRIKDSAHTRAKANTGAGECDNLRFKFGTSNLKSQIVTIKQDGQSASNRLSLLTKSMSAGLIGSVK